MTTKATIENDLRDYLNSLPDKKAKFTIEKLTPEFLEVKVLNEIDKPNMLRDFGNTQSDWERFNKAMIEWEKSESNRKTFRIPLPMAKENVVANYPATEIKDYIINEWITKYNTRAASHPYSEKDMIGFAEWIVREEWQVNIHSGNYEKKKATAIKREIVTPKELIQFYHNSLSPYHIADIWKMIYKEGDEITISIEDNEVKIVKDETPDGICGSEG